MRTIKRREDLNLHRPTRNIFLFIPDDAVDRRKLGFLPFYHSSFRPHSIKKNLY